MTDYGRPVEFGLFPSPQAADYPETLRVVRAADEQGLDLIGLQDHPYQRRFLETWTLVTALAAQTSRVRFFTDVANLPLRPPAVLAKAAASLDIVSGGRFELGLGAGGFWEAIRAYGGPDRTPGEAVDALEEALAVIRLLWSDERSVSFDGDHYAIHGVHPGPQPAHDIGIWLGANGPRMLNLTGRAADGWAASSPYAPPDKLPALHALIDEGAAEAGRDPSAVRRLYNVSGRITDGAGDAWLQGPVDHWVEELTRLVVEGGMDTFVFWADDSPVEQASRFAAEVAPAVRAAVSTQRRPV